MAAKLFPWLADVERVVRRKVDQPADEPGQPTWALEEWRQAFNDEQRFLWERISSIDRNFSVQVDDTITVSAGDTTTALPADLRMLKKVFVLGSNNREERIIRTASFDELGSWSAGEAAVYRPTENDLFWAVPSRQNLSLRIVYSAYPPVLAHGTVAAASAGTTMKLAEYESSDDSDYANLDLYIYAGTSAGSTRTGQSYVGATRVLTLDTALTVDTTSKYTSRPLLPVDAYDAYMYGVCARLVEKLQDERFAEFFAQREKKLMAMSTALQSLDRQEPLYTRDDMELGGHGDPILDWY